ncbi:MAG TPA: hypothetical protein VGR88_07770 [Ktedonobacterales bacterium]|nr:hypothetical protein [Ktedonobacterales bacterium]
MTPSPEGDLRASVRYGFIFGLAGLCLSGVPAFLRAPGGCVVGCGVFLCVLGLCFETGRWTTEHTGTTRSGVLAGAIAGALCGCGLTVSLALQMLRSPDAVQPPTPAGILAFSIILLAALVSIAAAAVGAGLGWYGALLGAKRAREHAPVG